MVDRLMYWGIVAFAGFALMLFVIDYAYIKGNQQLQKELNEKQLVINTAMKAQPLNNQLSQALYTASLENADEKAKIQALLVAQGFVIPSEAPVEAAVDDQNKAKN